MMATGSQIAPVPVTPPEHTNIPGLDFNRSLSLDGHNMTYYPPDPPLYLLIYCTLFYVLIFIVGVFGNLLVIYVINRNPDMKTPTNYFLVNLSIADLLVILVCMPTALVDIYSKEVWYLGPFMCRLVPYLENAVALSSLLTICGISFERYYAICYPFKAQYNCSFRRTLHVIAVVWLISLVSSIPFPVMTVYDEEILAGRTIPTCTTYSNEILSKLYLIVIYGVLFIVPLLMLVIMYGVIAKTLVSESLRAKSESDSGFSVKYRSRRQAAMILFAVAAVFFACLFPIRVVLLIATFGGQSLISLGLEGYLNLSNSVRLCFYLNSALNPVMYNIISTKFRRAFKRAFGCTRNNPVHVKRKGMWMHFTTASESSSDRVGLTLNSMPRSPSEKFLKFKTCKVPNCNRYIYTDGENFKQKVQL